jgi:hypothetical protein
MFKTWTGQAETMGPMASPSSRGQSGAVSAPGGWHPTILYLFVLLVAEVFVVGWISRTVLR